METQNQDAARSPAEVPNDPGKMFVGGLSWQTSPGKTLKEILERTNASFKDFALQNTYMIAITLIELCYYLEDVEIAVCHE